MKELNTKNIITDRCEVMGIFKLDEEEDKLKLKDLTYKKSSVKILSDEFGENVYIMKNNKVISILSKELFETARKIIYEWIGEIQEVWITKKKNQPVIFVNKPLAIIIAPRIECRMKTEKDLEEEDGHY